MGTMMPTKTSEQLSEAEKQLQPLAGEVDPKEARQKAAMFAAIERSRLKGGRAVQAATTQIPPKGRGSR
jgi:hypothetical protein